MADEQHVPVSVRVVNFPDPEKKRYNHTTAKTFIIDPTGVNGPVFEQIASYEPTRTRMLVFVIDAAIMLSTDVPRTKPAVSSASVAPEGLHVPNTANSYFELFGPDAWYVTAIAASSRVGVIKEYC